MNIIADWADVCVINLRDKPYPIDWYRNGAGSAVNKYLEIGNQIIWAFQTRSAIHSSGVRFYSHTLNLVVI